MMVRVKRCYAGDLGSIPWDTEDNGQCLPKLQLQSTKGVKTGTSYYLWEDSRAPSGVTADLFIMRWWPAWSSLD